MRRHQPSLCPWSHSAAFHLEGSGAQLWAELQPASQAALSHRGIQGVWDTQPLVWLILAKSFCSSSPLSQSSHPHCSSCQAGTTSIPCQLPPGYEGRGGQGLRPKCSCPGRALSCRTHGEPGMECVTHPTLSSHTKATSTPRHDLDLCQHRQGKPGPEEGWHGSPGWGPAPGTSREPSKQLLTAEALGHSRISPWQPQPECGPVPPACFCAKQEEDQVG